MIIKHDYYIQFDEFRGKYTPVNLSPQSIP